MFMLSYIGRGLVMGRSSAQRVLPKYLWHCFPNFLALWPNF
jgi:hypothetical protein